MAMHARIDAGARVALALCALAGGCQPREAEGALPMYAVLGPDGLVLHTRGAARRLAEADTVDTFCFDRDAKALIVTHARELARITLEGERTTLLQADGEVRFPDVSTRDGQIALSMLVGVGERQQWTVVVVDAHGGHLRVLAPGYDPCFTPDGGYVVFEVHGTSGTTLQILALDDPRATPEALGRPGEHDRHTPTVAPSGSEVVFSSGGQLCSLGLFDQVERTLTAPGAYDRFATFAPDGATLLFFRQADGRDQLVLRAPDGVQSAPFGIGARLAAFAPAPPPRDTLAARLADARGGAVALDDLTALGRADARRLGGWRGTSLSLRGLRQLEPLCARELARFAGALDLSGLEDLDGMGAELLSGYAANGEGFILRLDGLADPRSQTLQALARMRGWGLALGGLRKLDERHVEPLSGIAVAWLELGGLVELDLATAESIAAHWRNKWLLLAPDALVATGAEAALAKAQITLRRLR
jgi:hypothetical protein